MSQRSAVFLLLVSGFTSGATALQAAYCADPADRPAVCTVEAYAALEGDRMSSFELGGRVGIEPNQVFEIEIDAFDQNRRRFPKDRLAFDWDASSCRQWAEVERTDIGRIRITAGTSRGECDIWLWLPGNLNFEWRLALAIAPPERAGYSSSEADFVSQRLYQALLRRDPDPQGLRDTSAAILRGDLNGRIDEILRSEEFKTKARGAHPNWMLEQIYLGIFDRKPDPSAIQAFSRMVQSGRLGELIRELLASDEFQALLLKQQLEPRR